MFEKFQDFAKEMIVAKVDIPNEVPYGATLYTSVMTTNSMHREKIGKLLDAAQNDRERVTALLQNGTMTYRDMYLLETFLATGVLTSSQIHALFWPNSTRDAQRIRLVKLEKLSLIQSNSSHRHLLKGIGLKADNVYGLTELGQEMLAVYNGRQSQKQIPYDDEYYGIVGNNRLLKHHIMTSQIYATFKYGTRAVGTEMQWINEMWSLIRSESEDKELVRPDGFFKLYREDIERTVLGFVETDTRNTEWEKKIQSYEKAFVIGDWEQSLGSRFPTVFCVVPNEKAVDRVGKLIQENQSEVTYLVKSWQKLLEEDAFENWYIPHLGEYIERWLPKQLDI